jgi:hypothetical protein
MSERKSRGFLSRLGADLRARRNLEDYAIALAAFVMAALGLIEDAVSVEVKLSIMLAALGLLVLNLPRTQVDSRGLEDFVRERHELAPLSERLKTARQMWVYGPSASNLLNDANALNVQRHLLSSPDGELRVVIQNPDATDAVRLLTRVLDESVEVKMQDLPEEIENTIRRFEKFERMQFAGRFQWRMLDYNPGFSLVVIDPDHASGTVIFESYGFHQRSTDTRMTVEFSRAESERWFRYWVHQYEHLWQAAHAKEHPPA